jgi:phage portal protein BeeE
MVSSWRRKQDLRAEIAAALGVPPHMMGLTEKATSWGTGIEQLQIGLLAFTIRPGWSRGKSG